MNEEQNEQKAKKPKRTTKAERLQNAAQEVLEAVEEAKSAAEEAQQAFEEAMEAYKEAVEALASATQEIEDKLSNLREVRSEEYESWYENMPEGLQQGATGEKLQSLLDIDLDPGMPEMPEIPEFEELDWAPIEDAVQEILDADLPLGFGKD
jgi:exonuclease VII small subunit